MLIKVYRVYSEGSGELLIGFIRDLLSFFFPEAVVGYLELLGRWPADAPYFCVCGYL